MVRTHMPAVQPDDQNGRTARTIRSSHAWSTQRGVTACLTLILAMTFFRFAHDIVKMIFESDFVDFAHYYAYAAIAAHGLDLFHPDSMAAIDGLQTLRRAAGDPIYPPLFYLAMQPFSWLSFNAASLVWLFLNQLLLLASLIIALHTHGSASRLSTGIVLFVTLTYQPVIENFFLGQANIVLLFLVTLAWWGLCTRRSWVVAAALAAACQIKFQFGLLLPLVWWMGYRRTSLQAIGLVASSYALASWSLGQSHLLQLATFISSYSTNMADWSLNLAPRASFYRLLDDWGPGPMMAEGLWLITGMCLLLLLIRSTRASSWGTPSNLDAAWGMGLSAVILLSPYTQEHHLVVLLLPLTLLLCEIDRLRPRDLVLLIACLVLIGGRYSFEQFPAVHHGVLSLLLTGKMLGVATLAVLLSSRMPLRSNTGHENVMPGVIDSASSHSVHVGPHPKRPTFAEAR